MVQGVQGIEASILIVLLISWAIAAAISIVVAGAIYMLACLVFNKLAESLSSSSGPGPVSHPAGGWSPGGPTRPGGNPYAAPQSAGKNVVRCSTKNNVPMPSYPTALLIMFLTGLSALGLGICLYVLVLVAALNVKIPVVAGIIGLMAIAFYMAGCFMFTTAIGSKFLPTSFGRAALITLIFGMLYFGIAFILALVRGAIAAILG